MSDGIRNVIKVLAGAEDILHGAGKVTQVRGGVPVEVHKVDIPLAVADETELNATSLTEYPKVTLGSRLFVTINGVRQELYDVKPVIFGVGLTLTEDYSYCVNNDIIAKWNGALPKTLELSDADFSGADWQILGGGFGATIISETVPVLAYTGATWYHPGIPAMFIFYDDGTSAQWVQQASSVLSLGSSSGGGGGSGGTSDHSALFNRNSANQHSIAAITGLSTELSNITTAINGKQATLVSGTNIKTVNGMSLLGAGNLEIAGSGTSTIVWFDPMDYDAVGDGIADDTIPLNDAAAAAAAVGGALRLTPGKTFSFTTLYISDNVKCVFGYGSVLKQRSSGATRGVILQGVANGQVTNVRNCSLLGFTVDCNNLQSNGVSCNNASNILIKDVEIRNGFNGVGILIKAYSSGNEDSLRISLANCRVAGRTDGSALYSGILVEGENTSDAVTYWKANFAPVPSTRKPVSITISDCEVVGGYFGIKAEQAVGLIISSNRVLYTRDAIRLQDGVANASLSGNVCSEFTNSGISAWRGCSNVNVANNVFGSSVCNGDGPMFFVACRTLKTSGNSTSMLGSSPLYHLYAGPGCSDNDHSSNMLYGNASKAYICAESDWSSSTSEPASYSFGAASSLNNYVNAAMLITRFMANAIFPLSAGAHGIALLQTATQGLRGVTVDNSFFSNSTNNKALYLYENITNELRSCVLTANKFHPGANDSKFTLPRGKAHFSVLNSNAFLDSNLFFAPTVNNSPTPDVGLHSYISLAAYSTPTNVTDFANGFDGQELVVRLSVNATLIHNASLLALKGNVNVTGPDALKMIAFKRNSNVWFETWRNF